MTTWIIWISIALVAVATVGVIFGGTHDDDNPDGPYDGDGW